MRNKYLETFEPRTCYGCGMCEKACPRNAITMQKNEKGFCYPKVDSQACIDCGICEKVCPICIEKRNVGKSRLYAVEHKDEEVLKKSQSGGMFTALSDYVLSQKGTVYGAIVNTSFEVVHARAENSAERDAMCGSKYVQSILGRAILEDIDRDLTKGRLVLFTGTPCQCAAIQKNYGHFPNLLTCDFICHGTPSPKLWKDYLEYCSEQWGPIEKVIFRNKKYQNKGHNSESIYTVDNQEHISNNYATFFFSHLAHRSTCFSCQFASENRYADFTIGGFLDLDAIGFVGRYDVSMCFVNSKKAEVIFEKIQDKVKYKERPIQHFKNQPCLYRPIEKPGGYDAFWEDYEKYGFQYILKKYATDEIKKKYHLTINAD